MKQYELFIFDWDGTLMDTTQSIVDATQFACKQMGLPIVSSEAAKSIIGQSYQEALGLIIPEINGKPAEIQKFAENYLKYCNTHIHTERIFDHVYELLTHLEASEKIMAVATGRSRNMLDQALTTTGFNKFFVYTRTACECFSKPHTQMIDQILDFTGIDKSKAIMIGDTTHDLAMARNAGIDMVGVYHGAHNQQQLAKYQPNYLLPDISSLYNLF